MKKPREQDLTAPVLDYLRLRGVYAFRLNAGRIRTAHGSWVQLAPKGASDLIGILPGGRWLCVELKRPGEVPTAEQVAWLGGMRSRGALCLVAADVSELQAALDAAGV